MDKLLFFFGKMCLCQKEINWEMNVRDCLIKNNDDDDQDEM